MAEVATHSVEALEACMTAGVGSIAAARGVTLTVLESRVRAGAGRFLLNFTIAGDVPPETLRQIVEQSRTRSAVYAALSRDIPVDVTVTTRKRS